MNTLADSHGVVGAEQGTARLDDLVAPAPAPPDHSAAVISPARGIGSESELFRAIADLANDDSDEHRTDPDAVFARFADLAVTHLRCVQRCGVMLADGSGRFRSVAATDDFAHDIQRDQELSRQGPCVQAALRHHAVRIDDVIDDHRWPRFSHEVAGRTPVRSLLSVPIETAADTCGALTLYSDRAYAFGAHVEESGGILATHMVLVWKKAERQRQLHADLVGRDLLNQAKGILMERYNLDADEALTLITRLSDQTSTTVTAIAHAIVETRPLTRD